MERSGSLAREVQVRPVGGPWTDLGERRPGLDDIAGLHDDAAGVQMHIEREDFWGDFEDHLIAAIIFLGLQDGKPETTPNLPMIPETKEDYRQSGDPRNRPKKVFALYVHLHTGSVIVKAGDVVKAGAPLAKIGNTGPSNGPHLHFAIANKPDLSTGRSLPFVFDSFTYVGAIDFDASEADHVVILPDAREVRLAYPLYGSVQNYP